MMADINAATRHVAPPIRRIGLTPGVNPILVLAARNYKFHRDGDYIAIC